MNGELSIVEYFSKSIILSGKTNFVQNSFEVLIRLIVGLIV